MPRRELDFYETPPHYIAALLGEVNVWGHVFEPCVGDGAIANALRKLPAVGHVTTNDIDRNREADSHGDAKVLVSSAYGKFDWWITNPPFGEELPILENALDRCDNVAFLARLSFLEPTEEREYFLEQHAPDQVIVLPRYSFRPNDAGKRQTDSVTCAWLVWYADHAPRRTAVWGRGKSQAFADMRDL